MTTVLIWNNRKVHVRGHTYMGHAAMNIDDKWKWGHASAQSYVSFWPEASSGLLSKSSASYRNVSFVEDINAEGYAPDHILRISSLNLADMKAEWQKFRGLTKDYASLRRNCSTVVATVLKKGSPGGGVSLRHNAIWTPLKVKRLALAMGADTLGWTRFLAELVASGGMTMAEAQVLQELGKRDERHGSSTNQAYFAQGKRVTDKQFFSSDRPNQSFAFVGGGSGPQPGQQIASLGAFQGGTLYQSGTYTSSIDDDEGD